MEPLATPPGGASRQPYAWNAGEGPTFAHIVDFTVKVGERGTHNGAAVMEYTTRRGEEPGDHVHPNEDEMFYVLDGALTIRCAGREFEAETGGFVFLPRGLEHGYTIRGDSDVRLLIVTAPPRETDWQGFVSRVESRPRIR